MYITGLEKIFIYGEEFIPVHSNELKNDTDYIREKLNNGCTLIRLTYNGEKEIIDCTVYTLIDDGEIYICNVIPALEPEGYVLQENCHEDIFQQDELEDALAHWTPEGNYVEWYETTSQYFLENLDGPAICDFVEAWLNTNSGFTVKTKGDDFEAEDMEYDEF